MLAVYLRALLFALALVSSIGMQNIFVFNNAVSNPPRRAWLIAVFVWLADTALTTIAFLGIGAVISAHVLLKLAVMAIGGVIVVWMGWGILRSANQNALGQNHEMSLMEGWSGAWLVAFANPQAIIDTSVTLGAMHGTLKAAEVLPFYAGLVSASALWFFGITAVILLLRSRLPQKLLRWINVASGVIVALFGLNLLREAAVLAWQLTH